MQHLGDVTTPSQGLAIVQLLPPSARLYHTLLLAYGRKGNLRGITLLQSEALRDSRLTKVLCTLGNMCLGVWGCV